MQAKGEKMQDLRLIISQNIVSLRRKSGLTQIELAEKLSYSDKAVSKWERGESTPDITVLKAIADIFSVSVDYLISENHPEDQDEEPEGNEAVIKKIKRRRRMITGMSVLLVWVIATTLFVILDVAMSGGFGRFLVFVYAVPVSSIVWLVFNSLWHNRRFNYVIISLMMWSLIAAVHLSVIAGGVSIWQFYLLGIPGQIIILLWSVMGRKG